jgi:hypothetical protein
MVGFSMPVWRQGRLVWIPPAELDLDEGADVGEHQDNDLKQNRM